jgi:Skp family chaperone for outer membrane proteins
MNLRRRRLVPLALLAAAATALAFARPAPAPAAQASADAPVRVAVVNTVRVFNDLQETRALTAELQAEGKRLADQEKEMVGRIKSFEEQRGNLRADSPQYDQLEEQWTKAVMEHEVWAKSVKARVERNRKRQVRVIYEKIYAAIAEISQQDGYDLVLSDYRPQLTDKDMAGLSFDQLGAFMNQRRVLYASQKVDISQAVLARVDAAYKANPAAGASSGPAGGDAATGSPRLSQPNASTPGARRGNQ